MRLETKMRRIGGKVLAGAMAAAMMLSPVSSLTAFAAGNEQSNTGDGGVNITLNASQSEVEPGGEVNYTVTLSTTEYTGGAEVVLSLGESMTVSEASTQPIQRGMLSGQGTDTVTFTMTEFKPDDPDVVISVKAQAPSDLAEDTVKEATAKISYGEGEDGFDKEASVSVPVTVKQAFPTKGATTAKVTMIQTAGETSIVPGSKVAYKLTAALNSEIETVKDVEGVKINMDIPSDFTGVDVTGYKNGAPFAGSFTEGVASADFGTVRLEDVLEMEVVITIPDDCNFKDYEFKGYASGSEVTSDTQTMKLSTTETVERVQDEPSVYMVWKDLNTNKDRDFRTSDVLPVSIVITNRDANVDMTDVEVLMNVPVGFNVVEDLEAQGIVSDKTCFTWHIEKIKKGEKFTIDLGFVPTAGDVSDKFAVKADVSYSNNPLDADETLTTNTLKGKRVVPESDVLGIKVLQNDTDKEIVVSGGQNVAYTVTLTNNGEVDLKNVKVSGDIGAGLIYGKSNKSGVVQKDGTVTWTVDTLEAGKSQTMMFGVTLPKTGFESMYSFKMEGKADDIAEAKSNTVTMKTGSSDVIVEMYQKKSGMDEGTKDDMNVDYGETYTYVILVANEGKAAADSATVKMTIPSSVILNQSSLSKGMTYESNTLKWDISNLEAGKSVKANIRVTAPTGVSTNTTSADTKKMTVNVNSTISWTDKANNPGAAESNSLVTVFRQKETTDNTNNNTQNGQNNNNNNQNKTNNSGIEAVAVSKTTGNQMMAFVDSETIHVTAKYTKLLANTHYTGTVGLVNESGGVIKNKDGSDATARLDFTTGTTAATIGEFDFTIDGKAYAGKSIFAAMDVTPDGGQKRAYSGNGFEQSTIRSASVMGAAATYPTVGTSGTAQASTTVSYNNVQNGQSYLIEATLIDRSTGKALVSGSKEVKGTANFKAAGNKGQIDVPFSFSSADADGKELAVYVTLYDANGKNVLASDEDGNRTKTSGSALATGNGTKTNAANNKGDNREIVKTGQMDSVPGIMVFVGLCIMAGAGFLLFKKKDLFKTFFKK